MKTDQLIDILGATFEPADRGKTRRALLGAMVAGAAVAFVAMLVVLGPRPEATAMPREGFILLKLLFTLGVVALAAIFLFVLARPTVGRLKSIVLVAAPFAVVVAAAFVVLGRAPPRDWGGMIIGTECVTCLLAIPLLSVAPFAALVWALRKWGAPTDLAGAGAVVGLVAGGLGATAYAFHCPDDSVAFVATWYGITIGLCTFVGARLGPRLLRW